MIKPQSQIGWIHFSRDALRKAEARLKEEQEGVRDEVGFLLLHQAYADRFFPGTSVLQTRLRYIFFVPWIYLDLLKSHRTGDVERALKQKEIELVKRLLHNKDGVIGSKSFPEATSQPPSMVYWTALGTWGFLRPHFDGHMPPRSRIHRLISNRRASTHLFDDDGEPLEEKARIFVKIPDPPEAWENPEAKLKFRLTREEKTFLTKRLIALPAESDIQEMSLLARLVEKHVPVDVVSFPWERSILNIASAKEREALIRAMRIAALSAIGRGVYMYLTEEALENDGIETSRLHRDALEDLIEEYGAEANKLNVSEIVGDFPHLKKKKIIGILEATKAWLEKGNIDPSVLHACYADAEFSRKGSVRAKLPNTSFARERRREWGLNKGRISEPIHYRWKNVKRLLMDLRGAA